MIARTAYWEEEHSHHASLVDVVSDVHLVVNEEPPRS